jgi:hypothetical protein
MEIKKSIYQLHEENKVWLNVLLFYKDDIRIMQARIEEIAQKNTQKEVLAFVEHFQNQLIVQKEQIDVLNHEIKKQEFLLEQAAKKNPIAVDHQRFPDQDLQRDRIRSFEKIMEELRKELISFLSKWM